MKKILFFLFLITSFVSTAFAEDSFLTKTQEQFSTLVNKSVEYLENAQIETFVPFLQNIPAGTLAIVNGTEISYRQVEALADMELAARSDNRPVSLESISFDYAKYLAELIEQTLIHQELAKKDMLVGMDNVLEMEEVIRQSYGATSFEEILLEDNINPEFWREQMLSRLERETLQDYLSKQVVITEEEIRAYLNAHAKSLEKPEKYTLVLVSSPSEELIKEAHNSKVQRASSENKVYVQERVIALSALPDPWLEEVKKLSPGGFSPIRNINNAYSYLVFKEKTPSQTLTNLEAYALADRFLRDQKTAELYNKWLENALYSSKIFIAAQLAEVINNNKVQQ